MSALPTIVFSLLATSALLAQDPTSKPASKPTGTAEQKLIIVPDLPDTELADQPLTQEEKLKQLQASLEKLQQEKLSLENAAKNGGLVRSFQKRQELRSSLQNPHTVKVKGGGIRKRKARMLVGKELADLPATTIAAIERMPILQEELDQLVEFTRSHPAMGQANPKTAALEALFLARASEASFGRYATAAKNEIIKIQAELEAGADFGALAKRHSMDPETRINEGKMPEVSWKDPNLDRIFAQAMFSLKVGEVSDIVRTRYGFHLIKLLSLTKGDTPAKDRAQVQHIVKLYTPAKEKLGALHHKVNRGMIDLAIREESLRPHLPKQYK